MIRRGVKITILRYGALSFFTIFVSTVLALMVIMSSISTPKRPVPLFRVQGADTAPVKIESFTDFECPGCAMAHKKLTDAMAVYGDSVQIKFRHLPLSMHRWAMPAAIACDCAGQQGKFWQYSDELFNSQAVWSGKDDAPSFLNKIAKKNQLEMTKFQTCLKDEKIRQNIEIERNEAFFRRIYLTPTFIINGESFSGPQELADKTLDFDRIINESHKTN